MSNSIVHLGEKFRSQQEEQIVSRWAGWAKWAASFVSCHPHDQWWFRRRHAHILRTSQWRHPGVQPAFRSYLSFDLSRPRCYRTSRGDRGRPRSRLSTTHTAIQRHPHDYREKPNIRRSRSAFFRIELCEMFYNRVSVSKIKCDPERSTFFFWAGRDKNRWLLFTLFGCLRKSIRFWIRWFWRKKWNVASRFFLTWISIQRRLLLPFEIIFSDRFEKNARVVLVPNIGEVRKRNRECRFRGLLRHPDFFYAI
jgi:hypothetical protein